MEADSVHDVFGFQELTKDDVAEDVDEETVDEEEYVSLNGNIHTNTNTKCTHVKHKHQTPHRYFRIAADEDCHAQIAGNLFLLQLPRFYHCNFLVCSDINQMYIDARVKLEIANFTLPSIKNLWTHE